MRVAGCCGVGGGGMGVQRQGVGEQGVGLSWGSGS